MRKNKHFFGQGFLQIPAQLVAVLYVELVENAGNIVFDTAFGKAQSFGNYFVRKMFGY